MATWEKVKVGDFLFERDGRYKPDSQEIVDLQRIEKIDFSGNFHIADKPSKTDMIIIKNGDLVISGINVAKGAMGIYQGSSDITATIHYSSYTFDESKVSIEYFKRFLKSPVFIQSLKEQVKGGIKTEIKPKHLLPLEIMLPEKEEQLSIVSQFKRIENEDAELRHELAHQQTLLKKLRQQILKEAIEGKLTADWRAQNHNVEPASELLKRIASEKAKLVKDKKIKAQKPLPPIQDDEKPFELPQGWEWSRVGEISSVVTSGSRNWQSLYSTSGATFIRSQDIKLDKLCYANRAFVDVSKAKEGTRTLVSQHDWLIIITGANVGKCAYLDNPIEEAYVSQHVGLIRPMLKDVGIFGYYWLIADLGGRGLLSKFIYGDKPGLNLPQLRNLLIPIPPLEEQPTIVTAIEKLLALCDQLETQITQNQARADQLMQTLLKEAFDHDREAVSSAAKRKACADTSVGAVA